MSPCGGGAAAPAGGEGNSAAKSPQGGCDTERPLRGLALTPNLATSLPKTPLGTELPGMGRLSLPRAGKYLFTQNKGGYLLSHS